METPSITVREARPEDAEGISRVHVDSWHSTYRGIVPDDYLDGMTYEQRTPRWSARLTAPDRSDFIFLAETAEGEVVGFAAGGPERGSDPDYDGELYAIYIRKEHQWQGIGRRLAEAIRRRLVQAGMQHMLVWVLEANPSCHFYEALGGRPVSTKEIEIGGAFLPERSYGWRNVASIEF